MDSDMLGPLLSSLSKAMGPNLRKEADELLDLFVLEGLDTKQASTAVAELFSPPRVNVQLKKLRRAIPTIGLRPGSTFDLQYDENGDSYNFLTAVDRQRARDRVNREKPYLVIGSPPCT